MEIPAIYAIAAGGFISSFVLVKDLYYLASLKNIIGLVETIKLTLHFSFILGKES